MKLSDIDNVGTLRTVMEAVMDGGTTPPSVVAMAVPRLLAGDVLRMGGPEAIVNWALKELKRRKAIENGRGGLRVVHPHFTLQGRTVHVLPKETREKIVRAGHAQYSAFRIWVEWGRKQGRLPGRPIENPEVLTSIHRFGFRLELGLILKDENGETIDGRGREWALDQLGIPLSSAFVHTRPFGEGLEADAHRLADAIAMNTGRLSANTLRLIADRVLPEGSKETPGENLDELCELLAWGPTSDGLKKKIALELHAQGSLNIRAIARTLKVEPVTVDRWLGREVSRGESRVRQADDLVLRGRVRTLRNEGWTRDAIAKELGVSHGGLYPHYTALNAERLAATPSAEAWKELAYEAVCKTAKALPEFISDDVWTVGELPGSGELRALGSIFQRAKREGICEKTDKFKPSAASNQSGKPVWKSLIYEPPEAIGQG